MDCIYCGNQLSSQREIDKREICQECDISFRKSEACSKVWDLMLDGWGSLSAAMSVQKEFNLSDSDVDDVAYKCEMWKGDES